METENNKLIAEFMGYSLDKNNEYHIGEHPFTDPGGYGLMSERYDYKPDCLRFNYSWDWLMPVVEKIESFGYDVNIKGITCSVNRLLETETIVQWVCGNRQDKIGLVYKTVVEFINWYNENN